MDTNNGIVKNEILIDRFHILTIPTVRLLSGMPIRGHPYQLDEFLLLDV